MLLATSSILNYKPAINPVKKGTAKVSGVEGAGLLEDTVTREQVHTFPRRSCQPRKLTVTGKVQRLEKRASIDSIDFLEIIIFGNNLITSPQAYPFPIPRSIHVSPSPRHGNGRKGSGRGGLP